MNTNTDPLDELEVPHLKDRLWRDLAQLHQEQQHGQPAAPETVVDLARRRSRRSLRIGLGAAAAAAVAVGVVAAQLAGTDAGGSTDSASGGPLMERVVAATEEAAASSVVHTVDRQTLPGETEPSTILELWTDETSGATRFLSRDPKGDPVDDVGSLRGPTVDSPDHSGQRAVLYCTQEYTEITDTGAASLDVAPGRPLREQIAAGDLVEDGTETVDGRELIRLRSTLDEGDGTQVLLVDPDTFRPLRARGTFADSHGAASYEATIEYLSRTPENLALIVPPIPEGFTLAEPPFDEGDIVRQEACRNP